MMHGHEKSDSVIVAVQDGFDELMETRVGARIETQLRML